MSPPRPQGPYRGTAGRVQFILLLIRRGGAPSGAAELLARGDMGLRDMMGWFEE